MSLNTKKIHLVLFGIGNVGGTLLKQIELAQKSLKQQGIDLHIPVIANSQTAFFSVNDGDGESEQQYKCFGFQAFMDEIFLLNRTHLFEHVIAVDATASQELTEYYPKLIQEGFHIVSANKIANAQPFHWYEELRKQLQQYQRFFLYETNVGAALPVVETVKSLHDSGESIQKIRGVFSGSLSYIFNRFSEEDEPFSKVLQEASEKGLTEPDAREDLQGYDVARKLLILGRELGLRHNLEDVQVNSLLPSNLNGTNTLHEFHERLRELDTVFQKRKKALPKDHVLRYVGELSVVEERLDVKLITTPKDTPLGQLKGADAIVEIHSASYGEQPLVIQGAGAGKEVTARGLFADILKLAAKL